MSSQGKVVAQGTPKQLAESEDPEVHQFIRGEPDGPVRFHYPARPLAEDFGVGLEPAASPAAVAMSGPISGLAGARSSCCASSAITRLLRRAAPRLPGGAAPAVFVVAQIHSIGNLSLIIIVASGLAVGFVLALQMYYALVTYGAAESLGLLVNLSLMRELGPVVTALLFAGRAGTSLTAEIGLMKAGEQLAAMEMMAVDPVQPHAGAALLAGIVSMPLLAVLFSAVGILGA